MPARVVLWQRRPPRPFPDGAKRFPAKAVLIACGTMKFCFAQVLSTFVKTQCNTPKFPTLLICSSCPSHASNLHAARAFSSCPLQFCLYVAGRIRVELSFVIVRTSYQR